MADASVSKTDVRKDVRVRLPLSAHLDSRVWRQKPRLGIARGTRVAPQATAAAPALGSGGHV